MADAGAAAVRTRGHWIDSGDRPLLGWLSWPAEGLSDTAALILPPVGYEYWTSHRTLRTLAEGLAAQGTTVLRLDYDGTGDSAGDQWEPGRLAAWRGSVARGAAELRSLGVTRLVVVGLRLGATIALLEAAGVGADAVVAWAPIVSGRRYARELKLIGTPVPEHADLAQVDGAIVFGGSVFAGQTLADLADVDLATLPCSPAPDVLVVDSAARPSAATLATTFESLGTQVAYLALEGAETMLEQPTEYATVPAPILRTIRDWIGEGRPVPGREPPDRPAARITWRGGEIEERVVEVGRHRLVAVAGAPAEGEPRATVVFLNSGSEPHVGPGRAWVEYARTLNRAGHRTLRVDFTGWGESPDEGHAPGRPYDAHTVAETSELVRALTEAGDRDVVLVGLCAGAWVALAAVLESSPAAVIALNPQLYWKPGDPVEATMVETRARRTPDRLREEKWGRLGVWGVLDALGFRHRVATWLRAVARRRVPILMIFAEGDDGLEFFENRTRRALDAATRTGVVRVVTVPEIDHGMSRTWLRGGLEKRIVDFVETVGSSQGRREAASPAPSVVSVPGVDVDRLTSAVALARIEELVDSPGPSLVAFVNAHTVNLAARDARFRRVLSSAALVLNDGVGMAIAARLLGRPFPENLNGSDLLPRVLELAARRGWRVFFLGARPGVAAAAAVRMERNHPGLVICGVRDGYFPPESSPAVAAQIREARADLLFVGMGNPRQELWLDEWLAASGAKVGFGVGALFDFQSGQVRRAPAWMNRAGIEWAFRLVQEPRRLGSRYVVGNPVFLARVLVAAARKATTGRG